MLATNIFMSRQYACVKGSQAGGQQEEEGLCDLGWRAGIMEEAVREEAFDE